MNLGYIFFFLICVCMFLDVYSAVELLGQMVVLFLGF